MLAVLLTAVVLAASLFALLLLSREEQADDAAEKRTVAAAETGDLTRVVYASGSVQPLRQPGAYARTDGTVASTLVIQLKLS